MPSTLLRKLSAWRRVEKEQKWSKSKTGRLYVIDFLERETGIEPATNSLEGCDSTIELLPLAVLSAMIAIPAVR
jgi:hypothetical protein